MRRWLANRLFQFGWWIHPSPKEAHVPVDMFMPPRDAKISEVPTLTYADLPNGKTEVNRGWYLHESTPKTKSDDAAV